MSDLISRRALDAEIQKAQGSLESNSDHVWGMNKGHHAGLAWARRLCADAPAVDAVPVVRCFECANRGDKCKCPMCFDESDGIDFYQVDNTDDDGFCHYGERKEDSHATD